MINLQLPDPRHHGSDRESHWWPEIAAPVELRGRLEKMLAERADADIARALDAAPTQAAYSKLWHAMCDVANQRGVMPTPDAVVARLFALPLIIITGSRQPASLPGVVPDIAAITDLFEKHGALGAARNFGLGNALCSLETIESVKPGEIYAWTRDIGAVRRELAPSAITIPQSGEHVHLRFIVGAAIAPAAEPSFIETASNIGAWGMPLTRALATQLAQPNVEVLPLARPPLDVLNAAHTGRYAQLEAAFNLFASNAVRRMRGATGDPDAVIGAHDDGDLRISLSSPFEDTLNEGFRWPLHPLDDLAAVSGAIGDMLADCRISNVFYAQTVLPALDAKGQVWFARARDIQAASRAPSRH